MMRLSFIVFIVVTLFLSTIISAFAFQDIKSDQSYYIALTVDAENKKNVTDVVVYKNGKPVLRMPNRDLMAIVDGGIFVFANGVIEKRKISDGSLITAIKLPLNISRGNVRVSPEEVITILDRKNGVEVWDADKKKWVQLIPYGKLLLEMQHDFHKKWSYGMLISPDKTHVAFADVNYTGELTDVLVINISSETIRDFQEGVPIAWENSSTLIGLKNSEKTRSLCEWNVTTENTSIMNLSADNLAYYSGFIAHYIEPNQVQILTLSPLKEVANIHLMPQDSDVHGIKIYVSNQE